MNRDGDDIDWDADIAEWRRFQADHPERFEAAARAGVSTASLYADWLYWRYPSRSSHVPGNPRGVSPYPLPDRRPADRSATADPADPDTQS